MDADIEALLRAGDIETAAGLARERGYSRRAAELLALAGRHAEGVMLAIQSEEWRLALDLAFASSDDRILGAVSEELGKRADLAGIAAAHARIARRTDVAARILEPSAPREAAQAWYEIGDYARAARCFDRAGDGTQAMRCYEQHLAQTPDDGPVAERLGELRATHGDNEGAVRALQAAVRATGSTNAMRKLVDGLARIGLDGSARAVARRLRGLDPNAPMTIEAYAGSLPSSAGAEKRYAGRYRVIREVGSGATGRVLEAIDELTGDRVALKVLSVADDRSGAFGRFMREADLARVLEDPTLVRMRALDPEGPTIVYDWMPGGTLSDRIGTLQITEVRVIALRLLGGLETLHRNGIVHRDLKPSNVLFDPAGQARLGDLGAAHLNDLGVTVTGGLVGSLPYMAPEQVTGAPVSAATDLYAFGCVLFQMLTGVLPYPGPDFVTQHLSDSIPTVSGARAGLGTDYDSALNELLAKEPLTRPQEVAMVRKLLATLPWKDVDEESSARISRVSLLPAAGVEEGARLTPSSTAGRWTDARMGRDLELVTLPAALRAEAVRWAAASRSDLQAVYEIVDDGDSVVLWAEPVSGEREEVAGIPEPDRARILDALEQVGFEGRAAAAIHVIRTESHGRVVPVRILASR